MFLERKKNDGAFVKYTPRVCGVYSNAVKLCCCMVVGSLLLSLKSDQPPPKGLVMYRGIAVEIYVKCLVLNSCFLCVLSCLTAIQTVVKAGLSNVWRK